MKTRILTIVLLLATALGLSQPAMAYDIWSHKKIFRVGYTTQTIKSDALQLNSDYGANLEIGRTIFLHRKPIANLFKIGLDIQMSLDYAKFSEYNLNGIDDAPSYDYGYDYGYDYDNDADNGLPIEGIHEANLGIAIGPSFTFGLPKNFRAMAYFHFTPSWSVFIQDGDLNNSFVPYFSGGIEVGWKAIAIGYEFRSGSGNYNNLMDSLGGIVGDYTGDYGSESVKVKYKTKQSRIFLTLHF